MDLDYAPMAGLQIGGWQRCQPLNEELALPTNYSMEGMPMKS
ncbi:MAG: hypothetical protein VKL00_10995 [Synechococcales bacterium]|nr:hypothetical protein [Synechococcales bacterium]